jgi:histidyl-tRNA synthetase
LEATVSSTKWNWFKLSDDVFTRLKIDAVVKINNRKILSGIAEVIGENQPDCGYYGCHRQTR